MAGKPVQQQKQEQQVRELDVPDAGDDHIAWAFYADDGFLFGHAHVLCQCLPLNGCAYTKVGLELNQSQKSFLRGELR